MKLSFFATIKDPVLTRAAHLSVILGKRPSEILNLTGPERFLFEVDYRLVMQALGEDDQESEGEKLARIVEWKRKRLK
jgi:hypothetical protein